MYPVTNYLINALRNQSIPYNLNIMTSLDNECTPTIQIPYGCVNDLIVNKLSDVWLITFIHNVPIMFIYSATTRKMAMSTVDITDIVNSLRKSYNHETGVLRGLHYEK